MNLIERIQKFYLGFYGRPADVGGINYWLDQATGRYLNQDSQLAAAFGSTDQVEFRTLYGQSPSIQEFITRVYANLFGRPAEIEGIMEYGRFFDSYLAQGISSDEARAILIARIIDGASGSDRIAIQNKSKLAMSLTDELSLKVAAISDRTDLTTVQNFFSGDGSDFWYASAVNRLPSLVTSIQANDSVADFMNASVGNERTTTPNPEALGRVIYSRGFLLESDANTGQISGSVQIQLQGAKFAGAIGSNKGVVANVPKGLTAKLVKVSDDLATLSSQGKAAPHAFANSAVNIKVSFFDRDFVGATAAQIEGAVRENFGIGFIDAAIRVQDGTVLANGEIANSLSINLDTDTLLIGGKLGRPISGNLSYATGADLSQSSGPAGNKSVVQFVGDANDNSYLASYIGDFIRGGGGNDFLRGGPGKDTFIFEATAEANGVDTIAGFSIAQGDVLNFSAFLNVTGTSLVAAQTASTPQKAWANGDVLVYQGTPVTTSEELIALFDATGTDTTRPFSYARSDGKAVVITAGVTGDAHIWYLLKEKDATPVFQSAKNPITESEVSLVGVLQGVHNLTLVPFTAGNFL